MPETDTIKVYDSVQDVADQAASMMLNLAKKARDANRHGYVALSGGSTPKVMYQALASRGSQAKELLKHLHYFFGDERSVPNDDEQSNVRLAMEGFLSPLGIPPAQIHAPNGAATDLGEETARLTLELNRHLPKSKEQIPQFDLIFLGIGDDGHTASLFPQTEALQSIHPGYVANEVPQLDTRRLTLTYPVINNAKQIAILATGKGKAEVVSRMLNASAGKTEYPIQRIDHQRTYWLLDKEAAAALRSEPS